VGALSLRLRLGNTPFDAIMEALYRHIEP